MEGKGERGHAQQSWCSPGDRQRPQEGRQSWGDKQHLGKAADSGGWVEVETCHVIEQTYLEVYRPYNQYSPVVSLFLLEFIPRSSS